MFEPGQGPEDETLQAGENPRAGPAQPKASVKGPSSGTGISEIKEDSGISADQEPSRSNAATSPAKRLVEDSAPIAPRTPENVAPASSAPRHIASHSSMLDHVHPGVDEPTITGEEAKAVSSTVSKQNCQLSPPLLANL